MNGIEVAIRDALHCSWYVPRAEQLVCSLFAEVDAKACASSNGVRGALHVPYVTTPVLAGGSVP